VGEWVSASALDPDALRYERHWQPVLAPAGKRLLARLPEPPAVLLDVGAGTGALSLAAADRWPRARLLAVDASRAMSAVAQERADARSDRARFEWIVADAAELPLEPGSVDAVVCAFVLPGVGKRQALLRELRRVLRPGGTLAFVAWLAGPLAVAADGPYEQALAALGQASAATEPQADDGDGYGSADEARVDLEAAGFSAVDIGPDVLRYRWTREGYLDFKLDFDDRERFGPRSAAEWGSLRAAVLAAWAGLADDAFELRAPLVSGLVRAPAQAAKGVPSSGRHTLHGR
jgi:SAM-dependent methyltransferase